jgi:methylation protein EvaC
MKKEFLDLGKQPLGNKFLSEEQFDTEFFYNLKVVFDEDTKLVSMKEFVKPEQIFDAEYPYWTSKSVPMIEHFKNTAEMLKDEFKPNKVLEIGSNDGTFIKNFSREDSVCVEPCGNFAEYTNKELEYKTYPEYWTTELSEEIKSSYGKFDLIYSANCISHINDLEDTFQAAANLLTGRGVFVFEDPSCLSVLKRNSYDQIYDEHPHLFSVTSLDNLLNNHGLELCRVDNLEVHGGSNRIFARLISDNPPEDSVIDNLKREEEFGLNDFETYVEFGKRVEKSKEDLLEILHKAKSDGKKVMTIGATCKSSIVFNYCGIDSSLMECITDTTPDKQNLLAPGSHIPVVDRKDIDITKYDYAFLGAWNFIDYIRENEKEFKGEYITHVPEVRCV